MRSPVVIPKSKRHSNESFSIARKLKLLRRSSFAAVIHLRTPSADNGYDHSNPLRIESAAEAARIDERIAIAWAAHPRRFIVESTADFLTKAHRALAIIRAELPECCRSGSEGGTLLARV